MHFDTSGNVFVAYPGDLKSWNNVSQLNANNLDISRIFLLRGSGLVREENEKEKGRGKNHSKFLLFCESSYSL